MKKQNITCLLAALFPLLLFQALYSQERGFHFLRNTIGARAAAMAGAFTAIDGDIYAIASNPAALAGSSRKQGTLDYVNGVLDIQTGFVAFMHPVSFGNLAFSLYYKDYGSFDRLDEFGAEQGRFSANSMVLSAVFARQYTKQLWYGAAVKFIRASIAEFSASAFAADLTLFYDSGWFENLKIGGGIYNLGQASTAFVETKEQLPTRVEIGVSKELAHLPLRYSIAARKYFGEAFEVAAGGEFKLSEKFFLRLGYNSLGRDQKLSADSDRFAGVSLGFGLALRKYHIDYAFSSWGTIGSINRFSFTFTL